jgi:hypothetical protein
MKESLSKLLRRVAPRSLKARLYREASAAIARDMLSREAEMPRTDLKRDISRRHACCRTDRRCWRLCHLAA